MSSHRVRKRLCLPLIIEPQHEPAGPIAQPDHPPPRMSEQPCLALFAGNDRHLVGWDVEVDHGPSLRSFAARLEAAPDEAHERPAG